MTKASENLYPKVILEEVASDGSATANPAADHRALFLGEDGALHLRDSAGTVTAIGGAAGDITTDAAWAAKGDLIAATGNNAAAVVSVGTNGSSPRANSGASTGIEWQKNNLAASAAPAVTDDIDLGYTVGSRWIDTTHAKEYVCLANTDGAAVWTETTQAAGGGGLLAIKQYQPGSPSSWTTTSGTQADIDATNAAVTFTAPASGNVLVRITALTQCSTASKAGYLGLREGTTDIYAKQQVTYNQTAFYTLARTFYLSGVSAGSHTYKAAFASDSGNTFAVFYGAGNGEFTMEVWAAP